MIANRMAANPTSANLIHAMMSTHKEIRIDDEEAGGRLDRALAAHITELSRSRLKTLIEAGAVAIDGRTIRDPSHRVNSATAITVEVPEAEPAKPAAEAIPPHGGYAEGAHTM